MDCSEAGRRGAERRKEIDRGAIRAKAQLMRKAMGMKPDPRLNPPLILTKGDMI